MKRLGEKATREALENGAVIREWDWFAGGGYRVIIDDEGAGYITESLFYKLKEDGTIEKGCRAYSFTDYAKAEAEEATEAEPEETERERTDRENRAHCKRIADELEAYTEGTVYRCPECGEVIQWDNAQYNDDEGLYTCQCCGESFDECDLEPLGVYDFIADALDIEVSCSLDREYRGARIMVAFGGPNIYIDTARKAVELYWWTDRAEYPISSSAADALDEAIEEYWEVR